jgi:hypothetical protein
MACLLTLPIRATCVTDRSDMDDVVGLQRAVAGCGRP